MSEFTKERLAELRAVAEAATPGPWVFDPPGMWGDEDDIPQSAVRQIDSGSITWDDHGGEVFKPEDAAHIATFDPPTVLALIAALEAKTAEVEGYKQHFPCDGGCSYNDGPQEVCSLHGRNPRELWEVIGGLTRERDEARARAERLTPKQPDGWSTQDRQEAKQEAERRWTDDRGGYQSDFDRGGINGFILGAEWQKARETFISYKTIADEAEAALERVRAWAEVLAGPYPDSYLSSRGVGENILALIRTETGAVQ